MGCIEQGATANCQTMDFQKKSLVEQRYQIEILKIFIKGFNMCCMVIEKIMVIQNSLPEVQMTRRATLNLILNLMGSEAFSDEAIYIDHTFLTI